MCAAATPSLASGSLRARWLKSGSLLLVALGMAFGGYAWWDASQDSALRAECETASRSSHWMDLRLAADKWARRSPGNGTAWLYLAEAAAGQEDFQAAVAALAQVRGPEADRVTALTRQIELLFGPLNRPSDGAAACRQLLEIDPANELARQRLVFFCAMTLQREKLTEQLRADLIAGRAGPRDFVYYFLADSLQFTNASNVLSRWLHAEPDSETLVVAQAIHIARNLDGGVPADVEQVGVRVREAAAQREPVLNRLLEKYPENLELLAWHCEHAVLEGDADRVEQLLRSAPANAAADHRFWRFKGWLLTQRGELSAGEAAYRAALERRAIDWHTHHWLADLYRLMSRYESVQTEQQLAVRGGNLRRELMTAKDVASASFGQLQAIAEYAHDCGDKTLSDAIQKYLAGRSPDPAVDQTGSQPQRSAGVE